MDEEGKNLICGICKRPLKLTKIVFHYLDYSFTADIPACESCEQVYVPSSLARGRIREVETELEDK